MQRPASHVHYSVARLVLNNCLGLLLLCSLMHAQPPTEPDSNSDFTSYTVQTGSSVGSSIATDPTPSSRWKSTKAEEHLSHAAQLTQQIEQRIWRLDRFAQPTAWARLFAIWHDSGQWKQLQMKLNLPSTEFDLDKELDCGKVSDSWLEKALQGIRRRGETPTDRRRRVVSAATVLGILAPFGQGISDCVVVNLQYMAFYLGQARNVRLLCTFDNAADSSIAW